MILHIQVKPEDIDAGMPGVAASCPIACALKRQFGVRKGVYVFEDELKVAGRKLKKVPRSVTRFVRKFDETGMWGVQPFTFKLDTTKMVPAR